MCKNVALEAGPLAGLQNICFCAAGDTYKSIAKKNIRTAVSKTVRITKRFIVSDNLIDPINTIVLH